MDAAPQPVSDARVDSVLAVLRGAIARRDVYTQQKLRHLQTLRELAAKSATAAERLSIYGHLYEEYIHFQYDSAFVYAHRCHDLATAMDDGHETLAAVCRLIECQATGGFFKEAAEVAARVDTAALSAEERHTYHKQVAYLYQNLYMYVHGTPMLDEEYRRQHRLYTRLAHLNEGHDGLLWGYLNDGGRIPRAAVESRIAQAAGLPQPSHDAAVAYFIIGECQSRLGQRREAIYYLALSALNDLRTCTTETAASRLLATLLFEEGRVDDAFRFIRLAYDDATFYHSRLRQVEIGAVLPGIERERYAMVEREKWLWTALCLITLAALAVLAVLMRRLHRRGQHIARLNRQLTEQKAAVERTNATLETLNRELAEANAVKFRYIVESLYSNSTFVGRVEEKRHAAETKLLARQYADIPRLLREMDTRSERARMSSVFDTVFLSLFPTFIDQYNALFPPEGRISADENGALPTEARIFALLRLGIGDARVVGQYLNLTPNSIYVYRAKAKSRSLVGKDAFEAKIMEIPMH